MPTEDDIKYAAPLCRARRIIRNGPHGVHIVCFGPMRYELRVNRWRCGTCDATTPGETVAARVAGTIILEAA